MRIWRWIRIWTASRRAPFTGLEDPPQTPADAPGLKLKLTADALGSVSVGSPVTHHGIVVGKVEAYHLLEESEGLEIDVYIEPEYAHRVHASSRFWNASGIDISLGAEGIKGLGDVAGLAALGRACSSTTPQDSSASPVAHSGAVYRLYPDRTASSDVFKQTCEAVLYFTGSLRGLAVGAPVEFRGIRLGTVESFGIEDKPLDRALTRVVIDVEPERNRPRDQGRRVREGPHRPG